MYSVEPFNLQEYFSLGPVLVNSPKEPKTNQGPVKDQPKQQQVPSLPTQKKKDYSQKNQ
jgi:hypothetical protein